MLNPTPGDYHVVTPDDPEHLGSSPLRNVEIHDDFGRTATVYGELADPETMDTAKLFAAAPQMLEILREMAGVINMADSAHPNFADSGADVVGALWYKAAPQIRGLLRELDGPRLFALVDDQGTAMAETALTDEQFADDHERGQMEEIATRLRSPDCIDTEWHDVTDNDAIREFKLGS